MNNRQDNSKFNAKAFSEIERDLIAKPDFESTMRQVLAHPEKPIDKSENREPTVNEMKQLWKLGCR